MPASERFPPRFSVKELLKAYFGNFLALVVAGLAGQLATIPVQVNWFLRLLAVAVLAVSCWAGEGDGGAEAFAALQTALGERRPVMPRLSGGFVYAPWQQEIAGGGEGERAPARLPAVGTAESRRLVQAAARLRHEAERRPSAAGLHRLGIARLILHRDAADLDRALEDLEAARQLAPPSAALESDLAAAYLVRAEIAEEPLDLLRALSAAVRSVALDAAPAEGRFNYALALDHLGLRSAARLAWRWYLQRDTGSGWADEARRREEALAGPASEHLWAAVVAELAASPAGNLSTARQLAAGFPQAAREHAERVLLPRWAEARLTGRAPEARSALDLARALGEALAERGGDRLLADAVAAVDAAATPAGGDAGRRTVDLAAGHRAYAEGLDRLEQRRVTAAIRALATARDALRRAGSPFAARAEAELGVARFYHASFGLAGPAFDRLRRRLPAERYPSLEGRCAWMLGLLAVNQGEPVAAQLHYRQALEAFARTGEEENTARMQTLLAEALEALGQTRSAWRQRARALATAARRGRSPGLQTIFDEAAEAALLAGEAWPALALQNEAVAIARAGGDPAAEVDALLHRVPVHLQLGQHRSAEADLAGAAAAASRFTAEEAELRRRMEAEIHLYRGRLGIAREPLAAVAELSAALARFEASGYRFRLLEALLERGRSHLATGDVAAAEADFRAGLAECERQRSLPQEDEVKISFFARAAPLFDELVRLSLDHRGDALAALDLVESSRARALLDRLGGTGEETPRPFEQLRAELPPDTFLVEYAVLDDRLVTWVVGRDGITWDRRTVGAEALAARIDAFTAAVERDREDTAAGEAAQVLSDLLTAELHRRAPPGSRVVLIPDKDLHRLPFAALPGGAGGRLLIEDYVLLVAPSANAYAAALAGDRRLARAAPPRLVAFADPRFDTRLFPDLAPLRGSVREIQALGRLFPGTLIHTGAAATEERFLAALDGADVVHFGGHALLQRQPLLLLAAGDDGESGVVGAREIAGRRAAAGLVVLAACTTGRGTSVGGEGPDSLARAFLAAGVPAVVASLWPVDDEPTASFFLPFYRQLAAGSDPAAALREAQLAQLRRRDGAVPTSAWAAFQLLGAGAGPWPVAGGGER